MHLNFVDSYIIQFYNSLYEKTKYRHNNSISLSEFVKNKYDYVYLCDFYDVIAEYDILYGIHAYYILKQMKHNESYLDIYDFYFSSILYTEDIKKAISIELRLHKINKLLSK